MIFVSDIKAAVAHEFNVPVESMGEPDNRMGAREWEVSRPRQVAIALTAELTSHGQSKIGRLFGGRDHSTIAYACRIVGERRKANPELHDAMKRLTLRLVAR